MLEERTLSRGPASSVIVLVAPGTLDRTPELMELTEKLSNAKIRLATITYPGQLRAHPLDWLAQRTGGVSYTVTESKYNMATSFLSTYFRLTNVFWSLVGKYYQGDISDLRLEVCLKCVISVKNNLFRKSSKHFVLQTYFTFYLCRSKQKSRVKKRRYSKNQTILGIWGFHWNLDVLGPVFFGVQLSLVLKMVGSSSPTPPIPSQSFYLYIATTTYIQEFFLLNSILVLLTHSYSPHCLPQPCPSSQKI